MFNFFKINDEHTNIQFQTNDGKKRSKLNMSQSFDVETWKNCKARLNTKVCQWNKKLIVIWQNGLDLSIETK